MLQTRPRTLWECLTAMVTFSAAKRLDIGSTFRRSLALIRRSLTYATLAVIICWLISVGPPALPDCPTSHLQKLWRAADACAQAHASVVLEAPRGQLHQSRYPYSSLMNYCAYLLATAPVILVTSPSTDATRHIHRVVIPGPSVETLTVQGKEMLVDADLVDGHTHTFRVSAHKVRQYRPPFFACKLVICVGWRQL